MKKTIPFLFALIPFASSAQEVLMKDIFASAPDSIFPILTKNNKLDCIDFIENNMQAKVKNRLDKWSELKQLSTDFLAMQLSDKSDVQMKLMTADSLICVVRTYYGPAADSRVVFYDLHWNPMSRQSSKRPTPEEFMDDGIDTEAAGILKALPFIQGTLSPDSNTLTWELQATELNKSQREAAAEHLHTVTVEL